MYIIIAVHFQFHTFHCRHHTYYRAAETMATITLQPLHYHYHYTETMETVAWQSKHLRRKMARFSPLCVYTFIRYCPLEEHNTLELHCATCAIYNLSFPLLAHYASFTSGHILNCERFARTYHTRCGFTARQRRLLLSFCTGSGKQLGR